MPKILSCLDWVLITKEDLKFLLMWLIVPASAGILLTLGAICENMAASIAGIILFVIYVLYFLGAFLHESVSRRWNNMHSDEQVEAKR